MASIEQSVISRHCRVAKPLACVDRVQKKLAVSLSVNKCIIFNGLYRIVCAINRTTAEITYNVPRAVQS